MTAKRRIQMKYKQIAFDVDGTLIDTEYAILRSLQETVKTVTGRVFEMDSLKFALGIPGRDCLSMLNINEEDIPPALAMWDVNFNKYGDSISIFDGIPELLDALSHSGCEPGIVTSKTMEEFEHDFNRLEIKKYFRVVICADDTLEHKPHPAPLLKYIEVSKTDRRELLYVGDSKYDLKCARGADVDFALAAWGSSTAKTDALYYLRHPLDLLSIINSNDSRK